MLIECSCLFCKKLYKTKDSEIKRGNGKFCSKSCGAKYNRLLQKSAPNCTCALCGISFYKRPSKKLNSRSGLYFCCRKHKDLSQRIGGIENIRPRHYSTGLRSYRNKVLSDRPNQCASCGYNKHPEILEVHHMDRNRKNNSLSNLELLCPNCHQESHFLTRTGRWYKSYTTNGA